MGPKHKAAVTGLPRLRRPLPVGGILLRLVTILVYVFLYMPILVIVLMSFYPETYMTFPLPSYSLRWYREFFQDTLLMRASLNSLALGIATAILGALIGTPCAMGLVRFDFPGKRLLNTFVLAPMIIADTDAVRTPRYAAPSLPDAESSASAPAAPRLPTPAPPDTEA